MELSELIKILDCGEDTTHQFKRNIENHKSLAAEMVAFANGKGGMLIIGVSDDGEIVGLSKEEIQNLTKMVSNVASEHIKPAMNPFTENIMTDKGIVMIIEVPEGTDKPYQDKDGIFWVKSGADKRKATSRGEIQQIFQDAHLLYADEIPVRKTSIDDVDLEYFAFFYEKAFEELFINQTLPLPTLLQNMHLMEKNHLTLAGTLLIAKNPHFILPTFIIKAVAMNSYNIADSEFLDSRDFTGKLYDVFSSTLSFILTNIKHIQVEQSFNSVGKPEIPIETLEELIANALIHRDYFISAPIRIFVMRDRVEIISPGHLPNKLTIENIISGNSSPRNPVITSFAKYILPYRGIGSGIRRALRHYPDIEFIDDRDGDLFKVIIKRKYVV